MDSERTSDTQGTSDVLQRDTLEGICVRQLKELRQDAGCTLERLGESKFNKLVEILRERLTAVGRPTNSAACQEELKRTIERMHEPTLLLFALRLAEDADLPTLTQRRHRYLEVRSEDFDLRTLERRENKAISATVRLLLESPISQELQPPEPPSAANTGPEGDDAPMIEDQISAYLFAASGAIDRNIITRQVRAMTSNAHRTVQIAHHYLAENRPGVVEVSARFGCAVTGLRENSDGAVTGVLQILQDLEPDDGIYTYSWEAKVQSSVRAHPLTWWKPNRPGAGALEFCLKFTRPGIPLRAWWFAMASTYTAGIEPEQSEGRHLPLLDDGCFLRKRFDGGDTLLASDLFYGIAWIWSEDD